MTMETSPEVRKVQVPQLGCVAFVAGHLALRTEGCQMDTSMDTMWMLYRYYMMLYRYYRLYIYIIMYIYMYLWMLYGYNLDVALVYS